MNKFPHYFQSRSEASAQTCLQIVCKFYGVFHSTEYLNKVGVKSEKGAFSLRDTAELMGFRTKSQRIDLKELRTVGVPRILQLDKDYFVVLYKKKRNAYFISDPKNGLIKYNEAALSELCYETTEVESWVLEPKPDFYSAEISKLDGLDIKYLTSYLKPYKKILFQVLLGFFAGAILSLFFPFMTQAIIDVGISTANIDFIVLILIAQVVLVLSQIVIEFIRTWALMNVSLKIIITLVSDFLFKLTKLPLSFF